MASSWRCRARRLGRMKPVAIALLGARAGALMVGTFGVLAVPHGATGLSVLAVIGVVRDPCWAWLLALSLLGAGADLVLGSSAPRCSFRLGRVRGEARGPGLIAFVPFVDRVHRVSLRIVTMPIESQGIITRDNVSIDVSAVAYQMGSAVESSERSHPTGARPRASRRKRSLTCDAPGLIHVRDRGVLPYPAVRTPEHWHGLNVRRRDRACRRPGGDCFAYCAWSSKSRLPADDKRGCAEDPGRMTETGRILYTAEAHVTGGRAEGHGRTSDGALEVDLRTPEAMGGHGGGTNPEQLFAIGYAACFESALGVVARRRREEAGDVAIDSRVMLLPADERGFKLAVELAVTLPSIDNAQEAVGMVREAHRVCPYSNATRGNIDVSITANGHDIQ
jgi:lipoyl-dependent peroxiredoxin